ncbi:hypothetical protein EJB05_23600, partial [Eragrostis curvula]
MAHHPDLAYADYFAAGGVTTTVVSEVDAADGDPHHLYGVHQPGAEAFDVRGLVPVEMAAAHGKAALGGGGHLVDFSEHAHRQQQGHNHAPLTSLSLHGPAEAVSLALHQQHTLAGGEHRNPQAWPHQPGAWHMRGSRFLLPTQQLLQEFCSIPVETTRPAASKPPANEDGSAGSSSSAQIQAMDAAELNRLKAKLYTMLDEVDRRYRRYREQMRSVAGSFEAVAGAQAAAAYTRLASRTISRHFRTLRDGLAAQVEAVRRALGEKDAAAGVVAKGETTPRLRALEQCLRQQRAYHTGVMESQPWRPQRGLPERAVSILRVWLFEHFLHPYPSDVDKHILARQTGLSRSQVSNWFINARVRLWKPMVEEMYAEEMKDPDEGAGCSNANNNKDPSPSYASERQVRGGGGGVDGEDGGGGGERKPTRAQLVLHDAGSLASVVSVGSRDQPSLSFDVMDNHLGFGVYDDGHAATGGQGFGGGGSGGVSLTLGLQQHVDPRGGVNIAFAAAPSGAHEFMFMAGGEQQQMVAGGGGGGVYSSGHQFGASMEGDAAMSASRTNYHRGLSATGFQLLHDLAG